MSQVYSPESQMVHGRPSTRKLKLSYRLNYFVNLNLKSFARISFGRFGSKTQSGSKTEQGLHFDQLLSTEVSFVNLMIDFENYCEPAVGFMTAQKVGQICSV